MRDGMMMMKHRKIKRNTKKILEKLKINSWNGWKMWKKQDILLKR